VRELAQPDLDIVITLVDIQFGSDQDLPHGQQHLERRAARAGSTALPGTRSRTGLSLPRGFPFFEKILELRQILELLAALRDGRQVVEELRILGDELQQIELGNAAERAVFERFGVFFLQRSKES